MVRSRDGGTVDATDSKSVVRKGVRVRIPLPVLTLSTRSCVRNLRIALETHARTGKALSGFLANRRWSWCAGPGGAFIGFACPGTLPGPAGTSRPAPWKPPLIIPDRGYRLGRQRSPDHYRTGPFAASPTPPAGTVPLPEGWPLSIPRETLPSRHLPTW